MSDPPPYPPPPSEPPAGFVPAPTNATQYRAPRSFWAIIAAVLAIVVVLVAIAGYAVAGYAFTSSRISDASGAINTANAHRLFVNTTFDLLDQQVTAFNNSTDLTMAKSDAAEVVNQSQTMSSTEVGDDQALASVRVRLYDQQWLTSLNRGRINAAAGRLDHARKAVDTARTAAGDYVQLGQFLQAYAQVLTDWDLVASDTANHDFVGAASADSSMQADTTKALVASGAPGLPAEFHDFLTALQSYSADVGKFLNAIATQNSAALDAADKLLTADSAKLEAVDFSGTPAKIKTYYQRFRDDFNSEMDKATA
jgi:hypothetical protein